MVGSMYRAISLFFSCCSLFCGLSAIADSEATFTHENQDVVQARAALKRFNEAPRQIQSSDYPEDYQEHCQQQGSLTKSCVELILRQPNTVLRVLPSNPEYWDSFFNYLKTGTVGYHTEPNVKDLPQLQEVIDAALFWPQYALASEGMLDAEQVTKIVQQTRSLYTTSTTLIEKMIFTAVMGITPNMHSRAMAEAAAQNRRSDLLELSELTRALTSGELSYRRVMEGELAMVSAQLDLKFENLEQYRGYIEDQYQAEPKLLAKALANLPTGFELEQINRLNKAYAKYLPHLYEYVVQRSELSEEAFYAEDADTIVIPEFSDLSPDEIEQIHLNDPKPYNDYLIAAHQVNRLLLILSALSEIYLGNTSPGIPAQTPPNFWSWRWDEIVQQLCLTPSAVQVSREPEVCLYYWDLR